MHKRHVDRFLEAARYGPAPSRRRLAALAARAPAAAERVAAEFKAEYWWDPILDDVVALFAERARRLAQCAA